MAFSCFSLLLPATSTLPLLALPFFLLSLLILLHRVVVSSEPSGAEGPPTHLVIGCLAAFYRNRRRLLDWYTDLLSESHAQTIVVSRLGAPRTVVTANPANVEHVLRSHFRNYPKGEPFTAILGDLLGKGIFNTDGDLWHAQRKLASQQFTTRSLREIVAAAVESELEERLMPVLDSACREGTVVDMQDLLKRFAFDVICKVSLGTDPGFLDPSLPESGFARAFDVAAEISARRGAAPVQALWKAKRFLCVGSERRLREAVKRIRGEVLDIIHDRRERNDSHSHDHQEEEIRKDFLSSLMSCGLEEEVVVDMVISFVMAGRDTTSSALTWFFWLLTRHRDVEKEVVDEVTAAGELSYDAMKGLRMVKACLCESMRLYPPVAWDSKHAAEEDTLPDGTRVGKGDRVTYFPYGMGRMEAVWGKDCREFWPRRWLSPEGEEAPVSSYKFPVFQAGPRVCLGKEMAFVQMKYVAAAVLRRFELRPVEVREPVFVPLLTAHMANGLKVTVARRGGGGRDQQTT